MPEARHLTTFTHGLTDEQVADKERMLKEVLDNDSSLCPTIAELCVDFCVRQNLRANIGQCKGLLQDAALLQGPLRRNGAICAASMEYIVINDVH